MKKIFLLLFLTLSCLAMDPEKRELMSLLQQGIRLDSKDPLVVDLFNLIANDADTPFLHLSHRKIYAIDPEFLNFPHLKELNLSYNYLSSITGLFGALKNLTFLNLSNNPLKTLAKNDFSALRKLRDLDLAGTQLKKLPKNIFKKNKELIKLEISNNQLTDLNFLHEPEHVIIVTAINNPIETDITHFRNKKFCILTDDFSYSFLSDDSSSDDDSLSPETEQKS